MNDSAPVERSQEHNGITSNTEAQNNAAKTCLENLPNELLEMIFDNLDPVSSAFFGLTINICYAIHQRIHKTISLRTSNGLEGNRYDQLWGRIRGWIGPSYCYCSRCYKFLPAGEFRSRLHMPQHCVGNVRGRGLEDFKERIYVLMRLMHP